MSGDNPQSAAAETSDAAYINSEEELDDLSDRWGLIPGKSSKGKLTIRRKQFDNRLRRLIDEDGATRSDDWMRPYWLGLGLFLILFPFWLLDSLKDPVFGALIDGDLQTQQPTAKLVSMCMTLLIVLFLEYVNHERTTNLQKLKRRADEDVLNDNGTWNRMEVADAPISSEETTNDRVPSSIFASIGVPYCIVFGLMAYLLQYNPATSLDGKAVTKTTSRSYWTILGYALYVAIESFGSIMVATFWSYSNSTLALHEAERFYGIIIAFAQMGAIAGATMVTVHVWSSITLFIVACLVILLHIIVMITYHRRFPPSNEEEERHTETTPHHKVAEEPAFLSGVYLILKHNYVLLILGVSCLYEVSMTCLNYQMTLLGWSRFEETPDPLQSMSFTQFMGHYGQMVNISSLLLSSLVFPRLIRRFGLRITLRVFPTLLLIANLVAFVALPGNLAVLFTCLSILKAITYSIHDPAKEILYIPTSNAIKFKSKLWIDVVGDRVAKAIGSSINHMSSNVRRSIRVASAPSLLTAAALWYTCYRVGTQFEDLVATKTVVGVDDEPFRSHEALLDDNSERGNGPDGLASVELTAI